MIEDALAHQPRIISEPHDSKCIPILPVVLDPKFREQILQSLVMLLELCTDQLSKSIEILIRESGGQPVPKAILAHKQKLDDIHQTFHASIKS